MPDTDSNRSASELTAVWAVAFLTAAAVYLFSAAPGLLWGDSGECQLRVLLGHLFDHDHYSRSHILFYLVSCAFTRAGLDSAVTPTWVSALAGAATVANFALLSSELVRRWLAVLCGSILLMLSHSLWHLSTVAEINTFSTMLLSFELWLVIRFVKTRNVAWLVSAALFNGLGFSAHNLAMLLWPVYAVLLFQRWRAGAPFGWGKLLVGFCAFLVGAAPIIGLCIFLVQRDGEFGTVVHEMLMGRHAPNVYNASISLEIAFKSVMYTMYSFPTPILFLAPMGGVVLWRRSDRGIAIFLVLAFVVYFVFAFRYNVPDQHVFFLHSYLILAVFATLGVDWLIAGKNSVPVAIVSLILALPAPIIYAATPSVLTDFFPQLGAEFLPDRTIRHRDTARWFVQPWHRGYEGPELFAREILTALPDRAVLDIDSTAMPPLLYLQNAEDLRRDVQIPLGSAYQSWFDMKTDIKGPELDQVVAEGRMFTLMAERRYWNLLLRHDRFQGVPFDGVCKIVAAERNSPSSDKENTGLED